MYQQQKLEEFELPSHFTFDETKAKVKGWLNTPIGRDYRLAIVSERVIKLTKERHELKYCGASCVLTCISPFLVIPFMFVSYQMVLWGVFGMIALMALILGAGIGLYCLKPLRAIFIFQFTDDQPIRVITSGEGVLLKARGDYESLKTAIQRESMGNDGVGIW
ncbi:MAG: hypothetical protein ACFFF4_10925 [Candidatus Thorarchaeota archaeon]